MAIPITRGPRDFPLMFRAFLLDAKAGLILLEISDVGIPQSYIYIVVF
jgi:hypothetical protein